MTAPCFGHMTQMLQSLANGRLILVLEVKLVCICTSLKNLGLVLWAEGPTD